MEEVIGQNEGLIDFGTVGEKKRAQLEFARQVVQQGLQEYRTVVGDLAKDFDAYAPISEARSLFIEWFYYGPELLRWADGVGNILTLAADKAVSDSAFDARAAEVLGPGRGLLCGLQCRRGSQGVRRRVPALHGGHAGGLCAGCGHGGLGGRWRCPGHRR